jgi:hypothetical protein
MFWAQYRTYVLVCQDPILLNSVKIKGIANSIEVIGYGSALDTLENEVFGKRSSSR